MNRVQSICFFLLYVLFLLPHARAKADIEYWQGFNAIMPLTEYEHTKLQLQSFTVAQLAPRFDGIGLLRFSNGPLWILNPNFQLGAYADLIYIEAPADNPTQEYRFNLEPTFKGFWGEHFQWINRSRLEYRIFPERDSWRLRNKMRVNYKETLLGFTPFVDNEFFVSPRDTGFDQNRSRIGIQWPVAQGQSLELAYQWRWRKNRQELWDSDHILMLFYFFNPTPMEASQ
jgi:hypothetical protein